MAEEAVLHHHDLFEPGPGLRVLQAMVDTLLDGAPPELAVDLQQELPGPLKGSVRPYNAEAPGTVAVLLERFRERARLRGDVMHEARVAIRLLGDMLSPDMYEDLRASFPQDFRVLFDRVNPS